MEIKLQQRLSQQMVMTPQLQQAIKLMQMTSTELEAFIEEELLENPALERMEENQNEPLAAEWNMGLEEENQALAGEETSSSEHSGEEESFVPGEGGGSGDEAAASEEISEKRMAEDIDWESYLNTGNAILPPAAGEGSDYNEVSSFENYIGGAISLADHLEWQVNVSSDFSPEEREIAGRIIGALDERGYAPADIVDAVAADLSCSPDFVQAVLFKIQDLDPTGVAARSLEECLTTQAKSFGINNDIVYAIIDKYLEEASKGRTLQIAKELKVSEGEVRKALKQISRLEPWPARNFSYTPATAVRPDLTVIRNSAGEYEVSVEGNSSQQLCLSGYCKNPIFKDNAAAKVYLKERIGRAKWLIKSIYNRDNTLRLVMETIIAFQSDFFATGDIKTLKPLILKDVADQLEISESTVSRATANKYVETEHGIFPLRLFFKTSLASSAGDDVSTEGVRQTIAELIKGEDKAHPLSDQQLVDILQKKGIAVARRTVAKYRESLNIPSTSVRKRAIK